jgi:predicted nucleic acid-binding protein
MKIFADTSGLFALLAQNDQMHIQAKENFMYFAQQKAQLITSSFVLVETLALLQRRIGIPPVQDFHSFLFPLLETIWVDREWYNRGVQRLQTLNNRNLSLVDCLSFEIMEFKEISLAFSFDKHFTEAGFTLTTKNPLP